MCLLGWTQWFGDNRGKAINAKNYPSYCTPLFSAPVRPDIVCRLEISRLDCLVDAGSGISNRQWPLPEQAYPLQKPSAFVGQTVMPGYQNNLAFHPTRGLTPQSEMSESDDQRPLRTEEGPRAHACEPRADANNQNEFAVGVGAARANGAGSAGGRPAGQPHGNRPSHGSTPHRTRRGAHSGSVRGPGAIGADRVLARRADRRRTEAPPPASAWCSIVHAFQGHTVDSVIAAMEAGQPSRFKPSRDGAHAVVPQRSSMPWRQVPSLPAARCVGVPRAATS